MCGILGLVSKSPIEQQNFTASLAKLQRRGPDGSDSKLFSLRHGYAALGHTRLAIIDLSDGGRQPMLSDDSRFCIVFNGEIYNFKNIKIQLEKKGYRFYSHSDTEVLLNAFHEYGPNVVNHLDGMYAFAIIDTQNETVFLARDPFGKKPLFFYFDERTFAFASELTALKSLTDINSRLSINQYSVLQFYVFGFIPGPNSLYHQVEKLPPSQHVTFDLSTWRLGSRIEYWNPTLNSIETFNLSESDLISSIDQKIHNAVKKRLVADVPICVFLSGGVDSSLVAAHAMKCGANTKAFSVSFPGYKADESKYARQVASHLKIPHEIIEMHPQDLSNTADEMLSYIDEPIADAAMLPLYFLSKNVAKSFKVALSGDGGDEVFGGYIKYGAQEFVERTKILGAILGFLRHLEALPDSIRRFAEGASLPFARRQFIYGSGGFLLSELVKLLDIRRFDLDLIFLEFEKADAQLRHLDAINRSMFLDCRYQLPDWYLVKSDRASMANGVEIRSPLLDTELASMMFNVPGHVKVPNRQLKYLLKKVAARHLPVDVIYRPKLGFGVDTQSWMQTPYFKNLVFEQNTQFPLNRDWLEKNYLTMSPLKLMRIAFLNLFCKT